MSQLLTYIMEFHLTNNPTWVWENSLGELKDGLSVVLGRGSVVTTVLKSTDPLQI